MKNQTVISLFVMFIGLLSILSYIYFHILIKSQHNKFLYNSWKLLILIGLIIYNFTILGFHRNFVLSEKQDYFKKLKIPQIDTNMIFSYSGNHVDVFQSSSKDSTIHFSKEIIYDLGKIYSVTDIFKNRNNNLVLISTYITNSLLRDSSWKYQLVNYDQKLQIIKSINKSEFEHIITEWGLARKIYK